MTDADAVRHRSVRTASVDDAQRSMSELYGTEMDLTVLPQRGFGYAMSAVEDATMSIAALRFSGRCRSGTDSFPDVMIAHAVRGRHRWRVGDERGSGAVPFIVPPGVEMRVEFSGSRLRTAGFDCAYLREVVQSITGAPEVTFRFDGINGQRRRPFLAAEALATLEAALIDEPARGATSLARAQIVRHAAISLLTSFPIAELDTRADRGPQHRSIRLAIAFMEEHAHEPITVGDIAIAAGTTTRSLQDAFRRRFDMTPTQFLRRLRLRLAHDQLVTGAEAGLTVRAAAQRWGFAHAGRFAQQYLMEYGEHPSQTLRR
ncbi:helix-turn-helix domain-containing protein [Microbacterium sp. SS28]|uniref:AraC family transcriptional regulator n=1 Tax=Microbacterium sp. SS28 TaxID=2919948 RepID=UPI001FAB1A1B|nr:helix-turn-helix domain-containing protein [Microbacterium sp. SS28]